MAQWGYHVLKLTSLIIFVVTYGLLLLSAFLFPIDQEWYDQLAKPLWTPSGAVIGTVWTILYALIAWFVMILLKKSTWKKISNTVICIMVINYVTNQLFSFFLFTMKDLSLAFIDSFLVAITSWLLLFLSSKYVKRWSYLLLPYALWSTFATYLSYVILKMNSGI